MAYYDQVPDAKARKALKFGAFLEKTAPFAGIISEKKANMKSTGLTLITRYVNDYLHRSGYEEPSHGNPAYIMLALRKNDGRYENKIIYSVNSVAWKTVVARFTKLFAYFYVFPLVKEALQQIQANLLAKGEHDLAFENSARIKAFNEFVYDKDNTPPMEENWNTTFIYPPLENAILRDPYIQTTISNMCSSKKQDMMDNYLYKNRVKILTIVCAYMMNINPLLIGSVCRISPQKIIDSIASDHIRFVFYDNYLVVRKLLLEGKTFDQPMTPLKQETIVERCGIVYKGKDSEYVDPNY